jgi:hypothetical protein
MFELKKTCSIPKPAYCNISKYSRMIKICNYDPIPKLLIIYNCNITLTLYGPVEIPLLFSARLI